jgi:hypothetical protein
MVFVILLNEAHLNQIGSIKLFFNAALSIISASLIDAFALRIRFLISTSVLSSLSSHESHSLSLKYSIILSNNQIPYSI